MNNNLEKPGIIEKEKLSGEFYFQSLLEQGQAKGILTGSDIERLQYECLNFLAYKVERFNAGDSSSIRVEKAQDIMASNLFTIGLWLKTYQNPDDAIAAIQNERIAGLYEKGRQRIDIMLAATQAVHAKLLQRLVDTKNVFYRDTIDGGIKGFFKLYYPDFAAQEIHITADYPIYNAMPKLAGIEFIHAYLHALYYENQFCLNFAPDDIHHLLCGYEEDYPELLINIYELILTAALGCIVAGTDARRLDISAGGSAHLNRLFAKMATSEIMATVQKATHELEHICKFSAGLTQYVQRSLPQIADNIVTATREQALEHVFFRPAYPEHQPKLYFSFGNKMEDEQYRTVVNEISQCRFPPDKITLIKKHIHSLADLQDVLLDAALTPAEIQALLRQLSWPEIAALSQRYALMSGMAAVDFSEREQLLRKCLHDLVAALPPEQRELLAKASKAIEEV